MTDVWTAERKADLRRRLDAADFPGATEDEVQRLGEVRASDEDYTDFLTDSELDQRIRVNLDRACALAADVLQESV